MYLEFLQCPHLQVKQPDGREYNIWFKNILAQKKGKNRVTIGRLDENDIVLSSYKAVGRKHCAIECNAGRWWIVDESSANGTFVRRHQCATDIDVRSDGILPLKDRDAILIFVKFVNGQPIFWQFTFRDDGETEPIQQFQSPVVLEYSLSQEKLFRLTNQSQEEVKLCRKEKSLIHFMAQRNMGNNNQSVVCRYEEMLQAIWGDPFGYDNNAVTRLVWGIREKIEPDSGEPKFLKTERGQGYRLEIKIFR
ncbi:MAG: FHA domain-containing protein [Calothrix sp. MO_167.B12]|nr:FHA domain-containing protein [Calothrix sp. MO_167.B12]